MLLAMKIKAVMRMLPPIKIKAGNVYVTANEN